METEHEENQQEQQRLEKRGGQQANIIMPNNLFFDYPLDYNDQDTYDTGESLVEVFKLTSINISNHVLFCSFLFRLRVVRRRRRSRRRHDGSTAGGDSPGTGGGRKPQRE